MCVAVCSALRISVLGLCCLAWSACSVHDASRLDPLPISGGAASDAGSGGIAGSMPAGRGGQGGAGSGGSGSISGLGGVGAMGGDDGDAAVDDADADAGDATRCGDGLVSGMEICDTGIDADEPGACPTECPPLSECVMRALNGTGCRAECVVLQAQCSDDDDCCPGNCKPSNDNDCSSSCGDGIVQPEERETCEPEPDPDAGTGMACPAGCDDEDACTTDVKSGSPMNCNVECAHVEITALANGDACCPDGANAITDGDCMPVCGNGVRERGEDCDAQTGCNEECDLDYTAQQRECLDTLAVNNDACDLCTCTACTSTKLACFDDNDQARGELCVDLQACVRENGCFDSECFCGDSFGCVLPNGPCIPEIQAAAESINAFDIDGRKMNTNYAIGRSLALDICIMDECASACD
jgi:hypothetical protein